MQSALSQSAPVPESAEKYFMGLSGYQQIILLTAPFCSAATAII